jgi:hypothetical protein
MYLPMLYLDFSLGAGGVADGVLPTSQAFIYLQVVIPKRYTLVAEHKTRTLHNY